MIFSALKLLRNELNDFLQQGSGNSLAHLENIGTFDDQPSANQPEGVIITLVNTVEETALKNQKKTFKRGGESVLENPPVFLNLFVLFSVRLNDYETSLQRLSQVVEFFQGKSYFDHLNTPDPDAVFPQGECFKLTLELFSLDFEQLSNMWAYLGGKQYPSVLYRVRLVKLSQEQIQSSTGIIQRITLNRNSQGGSS